MRPDGLPRTPPAASRTQVALVIAIQRHSRRLLRAALAGQVGRKKTKAGRPSGAPALRPGVAPRHAPSQVAWSSSDPGSSSCLVWPLVSGSWSAAAALACSTQVDSHGSRARPRGSAARRLGGQLSTGADLPRGQRDNITLPPVPGRGHLAARRHSERPALSPRASRRPATQRRFTQHRRFAMPGK